MSARAPSRRRPRRRCYCARARPTTQRAVALARCARARSSATKVAASRAVAGRCCREQVARVAQQVGDDRAASASFLRGEPPPAARSPASSGGRRPPPAPRRRRRRRARAAATSRRTARLALDASWSRCSSKSGVLTVGVARVRARASRRPPAGGPAGGHDAAASMSRRRRRGRRWRALGGTPAVVLLGGWHRGARWAVRRPRVAAVARHSCGRRRQRAVGSDRDLCARGSALKRARARRAPAGRRRRAQQAARRTIAGLSLGRGRSQRSPAGLGRTSASDDCGRLRAALLVAALTTRRAAGASCRGRSFGR